MHEINHAYGAQSKPFSYRSVALFYLPTGGTSAAIIVASLTTSIFSVLIKMQASLQLHEIVVICFYCDLRITKLIFHMSVIKGIRNTDELCFRCK